MGAADSALDVVDSKTHGSTTNKVKAMHPEKRMQVIHSESSTTVETKHRRKVRKWCAWCGIPALALVVIITVLSQTLFKFRDPDITLSNVRFSGVQIDYSRPISPGSVNASLSANMNVYNPNHYNFKFTNSTIRVIYHDVMVGNISMPAGELRPRKAVALPALVTVGSLKLGRSIGNLSQDFVRNELPFAMSVNIPGRVDVVHLFTHDVVLEYHCDVTFWVGNSSMKDYLCWKKVHL